jgi:outer membrane protein
MIRFRSCGGVGRGRLAFALIVTLCAAGGAARSARAAAGATLTLEDAVHLAQSQHPQLAGRRAALERAQAVKDQATAGLLPGLTGDFTFAPQTPNYAPKPGFQRVLDQHTAAGVDTVVDATGNQVLVQCVPPTDANGNVQRSNCQSAPSFVPQPDYRLYQYWSASVGVSWVLFDWGKTLYASRAAAAMVSAEKASLQGSSADVVLNAKLAYFDALAADAAVGVAEEQAKNRGRHVDTARALHDAGRNTKVDITAAESFLAEGELVLERARATVTVARTALAAAIGDDTVHDYALVVPTVVANELPSDGAITAAVGRRPEVMDLSFRARGADASARSARGAYLPQLQVQAGSWWMGPTLDRLVTNVGGTVSLVFPGIYGMNPWLVRGTAHEAEAIRDGYAADERRMRNAVRLEAERARADVVAARRAVAASEKFVSAARERRDQVAGRYREGVGTFLELTDAELQYANARYENVRSQFDVGRAESRLTRAMP